MFYLLITLLALLSASSTPVLSQSTCTSSSAQVTACDPTLAAVAVPTPWFQMDFSTAPTPVTAFSQNIPWTATDNSEPMGCYQHSGVVTLNGGGVSDGNTPNYIDLFNASSPAAYPGATSNVLPGLIGGPSAGSVTDGTAGWSIEVTWKPTNQLTWAKLFNIGNGPAVSCFQFEWDGSSMTTQWTQYDASQNVGWYPVIPSTQTNTWYHAVVVMQQIVPTIAPQAQANWYVYLNGNLSSQNYEAFQYYPQAVLRPFAYIGRSQWTGDPLYQGLVDSFRIYNYALVQSQVSSLFQSAMGGCTTTFATTYTVPVSVAPNTPLPSTATPPTPAYAIEFATDPVSTAPPGWTWLPYDQDDVQCGLNTVHTGLVSLNDDTQTFESDNLGPFNYIDLGATGINQALAPAASTPAGPMSPTFIGTTTGAVAAGTAGFSLEITFKPELGSQWSKLIDFGSTRTNGGGNCANDIVFGWDNNNNVWQLQLCDPYNNGWQIANVGGNQPGTSGGFVSGQWYHAVIVFQTLPNGMASWYVFINNVLTSMLSNTYAPTAVARENLWLGRSGWGDTLWSGEIDHFRYYSQALGVNQVSTLFTAAMGAAGTRACMVTASTTTLIPASAIWFSATFDTDPRGVGDVPPAGTAAYGWQANDPSDIVANVHNGILILNGCNGSPCNSNGAWVNLSTSSGPNSIGQVMQNVGGLGTGSFDANTVGWSFEMTWKATQQVSWAKLMDLGVGYYGGEWEILYGWNNGNSYMTATVTTLFNTEYGISQASPNINIGTWYHTVWVIQASTALTGTSAANYFVYTNGVLSNQLIGGLNNGNQNSFYPPAVYRDAQNLGRSNWGDSYFMAELDTFNVYSIALTQNQVYGLYQKASQPPGGQVQFSCVGAGFDMTNVGNQDFSLNYNGLYWLVHPCGYIDNGTCAAGASFCQGTNVLSSFEPTLNPVLWQRVSGGVQLSVTDDAQCGSNPYGTTSVVRFLCSETAQIPYLAQVDETVACTYVAIIYTQQACQPPNPNLITAVGEPFASPVCGGGLYDLSALNTADIAWNGNGYQWYIRPCQLVGNANCTAVQPTSFCQIASNGYATSVSNYVATTGTPTVYTLTQQGSTYGLMMQIQDGNVCNNQFPRVAILTFVCDNTASTPVITNIVESPISYCHYTATIRTTAVCGAPVSTNGGQPSNTLLAPTQSPTLMPSTPVTCGGAGFDLSTSNTDLFYQQFGGYTYYVHPCGAFQGKQPCQGTNVSFCQASSEVLGASLVASYYNVSASQQWVQMPSGVQLTVATGDSCGSTAQNIYAVYNFICDTSAVAPQLNYVYQVESCHYEAYINTIQACTYYSGLKQSLALPGATFFSGMCGGGVFPLGGVAATANTPAIASVSSTELLFNGSLIGSPYSYVVRPCGNVVNPACAAVNPSSFCQYLGQPPVILYPSSAAAWSQTAAFNQWTVTNNGITLTIQDGSLCSAIGNAPRVGIFQFVCNASATTPSLQNVQEIETCHYIATISTALACPNQLLIAPPVTTVSSSSSSAATVVPSSSSFAAVAPSSTAAVVPPSTAASFVTSSSSSPVVSSSSSAASVLTSSTAASVATSSAGAVVATSSTASVVPSSSAGAVVASSSAPVTPTLTPTSNPSVPSPSSSTGSSGNGNGGTVVVSSTSHSLTSGQLAAAIVVPVVGALLLACLCFILGRAMSGGGGKGTKTEGPSRSNSHQPHYDEQSRAAGDDGTHGGVEMA